MSKPDPNPTRLSRLPETEDPLGLGRMFRDARELPEEDLPALRWRLRTSQRLRVTRPRLVMRVALVAGVVFFMGSVVGAVVAPILSRRPPALDGDAVAPPTAKPHRAKPRPVRPTPALPAPGEPAVDTSDSLPSAPPPAPAPTVSGPVHGPAKSRSPVRVAVVHELTPPAVPVIPPETPVAPAPIPPSRISLEQGLLGEAMQTLRERHDARAALGLLARYAERFPDGALTSEATMLRIEALLTLGRRAEALSILDEAPLASLPNRDEQLVARGELRLADGRWREARQDFEAALRVHTLPAAGVKAQRLQERALWGRATTRSRLGDVDGARADIKLYLRHFPAGRFAGPAASLLGAAP